VAGLAAARAQLLLLAVVVVVGQRLVQALGVAGRAGASAIARHRPSTWQQRSSSSSRRRPAIGQEW